MDLRDFISLSIIALAVGALWTTGRKGAKGAAMLLGAAALGAIFSQLFTSAAAHRINQVLSPPLTSEQSSLGPPSNSLTEDAPSRTDTLITYIPTPEQQHSAVGSKGSSPIQSPAPSVRQTPPSTPEGKDVASSPTSGGGLEVVVQGSLNASAPDEVESAIVNELQSTGWGGFSSGGYKRLRISGSLRDLDMTLGQIPTASISASWVLRSASGQVIAEGGVSDLRGTGIDQESARTAALAWACRNIAAEITRRNP
jgi:hypothetical protein